MTVQQPVPIRRRRRFSEVAGNTTAECTAVCCCVPCAVIDMVALAAYKVPTGLWKKAMYHKRKRRLVKLQQKKNEEEPETVIVGSTLEEHLAKGSPEVAKLEEEMWARFSGTGFWRSSSQRHQLEPEMQPEEKDR